MTSQALRASSIACAAVAATDVWLVLRNVTEGPGSWLGCVVVCLAWAAAAVVLAGWLAVVTTVARRAGLDGSWSAATAAIPSAVVIGLNVARTRWAIEHLGGSAAPVALALVATTWLIGRLDRAATRTCRAALLLIGSVALVAQVSLPIRLYVPVHVVLLTTALTTLAAAAWTRPTAHASRRWRSVAVGLAAAALAFALARAIPAARGAVFAHAPSTSDLLAVLAAQPTAPAPAAPTGRSVRSALPRPAADAHVVLITVDALRADRLGTFGGAVPTSSLDALAAGATVYERAYATAPHTAFSLTSLLTGRRPDAAAAARVPTIAELLRERGWRTYAWYPDGLFFDGKRRLAAYAQTHFGFDRCDTQTRDAAGTTDAVLGALAELRRSGEPPALLWVHYFDPHEPYEAHDVPGGAAPSERYDSEIRYTEREIGRLLDGLRTLARPTIIVFAADHGEEFGDHGGAYHGSSLYEEQIRVPLIVRGLGGTAGRVASPVSLLDVAPTLLSALGIDFAGDGRDLPTGTGDDVDVLAQVHDARMLVRGPWKLIHHARGDYDELYHLATDPRERRDVAAGEPEVATQLRLALDRATGALTAAQLADRLLDTSAAADERVAAAAELARAPARDALRPLQRALDDEDPAVASEAALALAEHDDRTAIPRLRRLLGHPRLGARAAVALARLREPGTSDALLEVARSDADSELRRRAIRQLAALSGGDSVAALCSIADDIRVRADAYLALGRIAARARSRAAADCLLSHLPHEEYDDARARLVQALGLAGDPRAIPVIASLVAVRPTPFAAESLVRLHALDGGPVSGVDFSPELEHAGGTFGLADCRRRQTSDPFVYEGVTTCRLAARSARLRVSRRRRSAATLLVRARSLVAPARLIVRINGHVVGELELDATFAERRLSIAAGAMRVGVNTIELQPHGSVGPHDGVELDHALFVDAADST